MRLLLRPPRLCLRSQHLHSSQWLPRLPHLPLTAAAHAHYMPSTPSARARIAQSGIVSGVLCTTAAVCSRWCAVRGISRRRVSTQSRSWRTAPSTMKRPSRRWKWRCGSRQSLLLLPRCCLCGVRFPRVVVRQRGSGTKRAVGLEHAGPWARLI